MAKPCLWELPHSSPWDAGKCPNPSLGFGNCPIPAPWMQGIVQTPVFLPQTPRLLQPPPHCQVFTSFLGSFLVEGETQAGFLPCPRCSSAFTPKDLIGVPWERGSSPWAEAGRAQPVGLGRVSLSALLRSGVYQLWASTGCPQTSCPWHPAGSSFHGRCWPGEHLGW